MPDRDKPRWARVVGAIICSTCYVMVLLVALGDTLVPSLTIDGVVPDVQIGLTAALMAVLCLIGLVAVPLRRWRWEWVSSSILVFLVLGRSVPVWASLVEVPSRLAAAAMMVTAAMAFAHRAAGLWLFAVTTQRVAQAAARHRRRR